MAYYVIFKFHELCMFDLLIFSVMFVHMTVIYCDNISHCGLFLADKKVSSVLVRSSVFYYSKK